jgi:hypothetical protein
MQYTIEPGKEAIKKPKRNRYCWKNIQLEMKRKFTYSKKKTFKYTQSRFHTFVLVG